MRDTSKYTTHGLVPSKSIYPRANRCSNTRVYRAGDPAIAIPSHPSTRRSYSVYGIGRTIARWIYSRNHGPKGEGIMHKALDLCLALASFYVIVSIVGGFV